MIVTVIVASALLVGQTTAPTHSGSKQKTPSKAASADDLQKAESEYNLLKEKTPMTAAARWKLALWCEEHGLKDIAYVHFGEVISLDPKRDAAWKRLGFKKHGKHWATDAQIAEEHEQKKADKLWGPRLNNVHKDIHGANGKPKKDLAQALLDKIVDPRAVLSVYREFAGGGKSDQSILIDVLDRIDKPISSKVLAMIAVYGKTTDVRRRAIEVLRDRPSQDFIDVLVALMTDEYKYEVRPVGGPGSPGVLFVEGEKFNVRRFYVPPAAPNIMPQPGDVITYDSNGMPIINRPVRQSTIISAKPPASGTKNLLEQPEQAIIEYEAISPSALAMEAQRGALAARSQLEADVNMIKSINEKRKKFNDLVMAVAKDATLKDGGKTPKEWRETLAAGSPRARRPPPPSEHTVKWWPLRTTPIWCRWAYPPKPCSMSTSTWMSERIYTNSFRSGSSLDESQTVAHLGPGLPNGSRGNPASKSNDSASLRRRESSWRSQKVADASVGERQAVEPPALSARFPVRA